MGLVVNRPGEITLAQAIPDMPLSSEPLFVGGPVQRDIVLVLHRSPEVTGAHSICDGIVLGGEQDEVMQLLQSARGDKRRVRVFSGYAGWGAGQLEDEMRVKSWIVCPATAHFVFDVEPHDAWSEVLRSLGPTFAHLTTMPLDPRVN
jgi:putative transcriptional regulator